MGAGRGLDSNAPQSDNIDTKWGMGGESVRSGLGDLKEKKWPATRRTSPYAHKGAPKHGGCSSAGFRAHEMRKAAVPFHSA